MKFIADFHVHSHFSIATAKNLNLENLYVSAQQKGITLVGTGDFTHPKWFSEISDKLKPAEPGLFKLRDDIERTCDADVPESCRGPVRFIIQGEISTVYKKNGKTRKVHSVICLSELEQARRMNSRLDTIGNIKSDGRPIIGLDTKELLKIVLDISDDAMFIPAHIWTPWFSVLGSKSGFDSLEECFDDLLPHIFAAETGLSSDPPMNWRVSFLDKLTLISNSDAHSPATLGRNANVFDTDLSYPAVRSALESGSPKQCLGTLDLYPQEGKYHYDGHRKCNVRFHPRESIAHDNICPVCRKPLTIGVLYRVEQLADRPENEIPDHALPCHHIIPLGEILSELLNVGKTSKKVNESYHMILRSLGPELHILHFHEIESIRQSGIPLLDEAIQRMRDGHVHLSPGYDGEYGIITLFGEDEKASLLGQRSLFGTPKDTKRSTKKISETPLPFKPTKTADLPVPQEDAADGFSRLNAEQLRAVQHERGPLLIIAGPGSGKTRTLTYRIAFLIREKNIKPDEILAVTFTHKAAQEMKQRIETLLDSSSRSLPFVGTFHALCFQILKEQGHSDYSIIDDDDRHQFIAEAINRVKQDGIPVHLSPARLADAIISAKQLLLLPSECGSLIAKPADAQVVSAVYRAYQSILELETCYDYEDLIFNAVRLFETNDRIREHYRDRFPYIFVDEYQDLNQGQYRLIRALAPQDKNLCVIGDPDQAIYGFRGADVAYFKRFVDDYPGCTVIHLKKNYRSTETILNASHQIIRHHRIDPSDERVYSDIDGVKTLTILQVESERAEAVAIGKHIEKFVGGIGFHSFDFGKTDDSGDRSFSDFAVLFRTHSQADVIGQVLGDAGIPFQIVNKKDWLGNRDIGCLISLLKIAEGTGKLPDYQRIADLKNSGISKKAFRLFKEFAIQQRITPKNAMESFNEDMEPEIQRQIYTFSETISNYLSQISGSSVEGKLRSMIKFIPLKSNIENQPKTQDAFNRLLALASDFQNDTRAFLEMIAFQTDPDVYDQMAEKVSLMTMHAAKGLEFPIVFIAGCEDGYVPFKRGYDEGVDPDEERRLFYVAMTRAKDRLFLSYAKKRIVYGKSLSREISPFVKDIEQHLLSVETSNYRSKKNKEPEQLGLF